MGRRYKRKQYFELGERIENIRTRRKGAIVGFSRCSDEFLILYDGEKKAIFEKSYEVGKIKE